MPDNKNNISLWIFRPILLNLIMLCSLSCQTQNPKFDSALENQRCESALEEIPEEQVGLKLASKTQKVMGTVFSYTATAGGYTTQIFLDTSRSTGYILACELISLPMGSLGGNAVDRCLRSAFKDYRMFKFGQNTYSKTAPFRCSNLNGLSDSILKVSDCYLSRNTNEANQRALKYLKSIEQSDEFYNCLPEAKRNSISLKIQSIEQALTQTPIP